MIDSSGPEDSDRRRVRTAQREAGFTVVEVAVAVILFTIVMGAIYGLLRVARAGRLNVNTRAEALQNARIALNTLSRDAINAGVGYPNLGATLPDNRLSALLGGAGDEDADPDLLTPVHALNDVNKVNGVDTDQVTFIFIDDTFDDGNSLPISAVKGEGAELTLQSGFDNSPCRQGDVYIFTGQNGSALGVLKQGDEDSDSDAISLAAGDKLGINNPGAGSPIAKITAPGSILRVSWVSYFVAPEDRNGTGTGTLMRRVYGGDSGWSDQPLAFGVENFQVQYVLINGVVVDVPAANQMDDIRQVRVSVTVRSPDIDPATHEPFRTTLTSTFSTRNLVYEKI